AAAMPAQRKSSSPRAIQDARALRGRRVPLRFPTSALVSFRRPSCTSPCRPSDPRCSYRAMAETRTGPHGLAFAPTKIGVLIDLDMGTKEDFLACLRFAFDEAVEQRVLLRPVELVVKEAIGLPRLEARNTIEGYRWLVEQGVLCTIGPLITDN